MQQFKTYGKIKPESQTSEYSVHNNKVLYRNSYCSTFDEIFPVTVTNGKVFESIKPIIEKFLNGHHCTIIGYGPPGTGKTHTLFGSNDKQGLFHYIVRSLFEDYLKKYKSDIIIRCSYFEISKDKIKDLNSPDDTFVNVSFDPASKKTKYRNLRTLICINATDAIQRKQLADKNRSKKLNDSHTIYRFSIELNSKKVDDMFLSKSLICDLDLVELNFNESAPFTDIIKKIGSGATPIIEPKNCLEVVMSNCLTGNSYTTVICTMQFSIFLETKRVLQFANVSRSVKIQPFQQKYYQIEADYFHKLNSGFNELLQLQMLESPKRALNSLIRVSNFGSVEKDSFLSLSNSVELQLNKFFQYCSKIEHLREFSSELKQFISDFEEMKYLFESDKLTKTINNTSVDKTAQFENCLKTLKNNLLPKSILQCDSNNTTKPMNNTYMADSCIDLTANNISLLSLTNINKENKAPTGSSNQSTPITASSSDMQLVSSRKTLKEANVALYQEPNVSLDSESLKIETAAENENTDGKQWKSYDTKRVLVRSQHSQTN